MRTIRSLTSGMTKEQVSVIQTNKANDQIEHDGQVERELGQISSVFHPRDHCEHLILKVQIATAYREDQQKLEAAVITNDHHSKVNAEELSHKWEFRQPKTR